MDQSQQVKEQIKFDVERAVGKVFRKKPIKAISEDSKGWKFSLGYGKENRRVWQRYKTHEEAQIFKSLWNKGVHQKDETLLEALTEEGAYRTKLAKIGLEGLPYDLLDAVNFFKKHGCPKKGRIKVSEAVEVFSERRADKKTRTSQSDIGQRNHKANFQPLIDKFGSRLLIDISSDEVEKWFREREARREKETGSSWSPSTWNSYRRVLIGFWNELSRQNYCSEALNPFQQLVRRDIRDGNIRTKIKLAPVVKEFFHFLEDKANTTRCDHREGMWRDIGALVLMWFCGVRSEEKDRTSWEDLNRNVTYAQQHNLADSTGWELSIYATEEKTTTSKILPVPKNAQKWLRLVEAKIGSLKGDIIHSDFFQRYEARKREFKQTAGHTILQNSHRHTFASHHYAFYGSEELTKRRMGHTEDSTTLFNNYLSVINFTTAAPYHEIIPRQVEKIESWEKEVEKLLPVIGKIRALSNIKKITFDEDGNLAPVQKWDDWDEQYEYFSPPDGVKFEKGMVLLPDDDAEVVALLHPSPFQDWS